jgi:hypothetical protein
MVRLFAPTTLSLVLLATALTGSASAAQGSGLAATSAPVVAQVSGPGWTRPVDVAPLTDLSSATSVGGKAAAGAGAFQIISQAPWPGDKVRVFFFGVQG